jgi:hypothetical protein
MLTMRPYFAFTIFGATARAQELAGSRRAARVPILIG